MCQTLFFIPHSLWGVPVFGFGWLLGVWGVLALAWTVWTVRKSGGTAELLELLPFLLLTGAGIVFVLPRLEVAGPDGELLGLPIRGYGTLLLAGVVAGWGLSVRRAVDRGWDAELIASLGWRLFLAGIVGARIFFVVEYWSEFQRPTWTQTLVEILKFTEGGLVVYGSLIGGFLAFVWFARSRRLSTLALGDVIAPGVILGMAIGRLGCLMNGCCYGGECRTDVWSIQFPRYSSVAQQVQSPPYRHQLELGRLHGFTLGSNPQGEPVVRSVDAGSRAEQSGLTAGAPIAAINGLATPTTQAAKEVLAMAGPTISVELADGQTLRWTIETMPARSLRVYPSQIYGAVSGLLICLVLLAIEPYFRRDGVVMAALLTLYPPVRFLEEIIRDDEPAQWGTSLTISQLISLLVLAGAAGLWVYLAVLARRAPHAGSRPETG